MIAATSLVVLANLYITKKYTPELVVDIKQFSKGAVKSLVVEGIWNSLNSLQNIQWKYGAYGAREAISKRDLFVPADYEFEGKKYIGPKNADLYLSKLYGKYMELPPIEKRTDHKLKAWYI